MSIPTPSEEATPCCCKKNAGMVIKSLIILCLIVPLILAALQINFLVVSLILLVGIILSIFAIINGSKAFGITMLIVLVLVGGPGSCGVAVILNKDVRSVLNQSVEQVKVQAALDQKLEAAKAAGNKEEAAKIQAEIDAAQKQLEKELEKKLSR